MSSNAFAKTVVFSSALTVLLLLGVMFIFRAYIIDAVLAELPPTEAESTAVVQNQPATSEYEAAVTNAIASANEAVVSVVVTKDVPVYERYYESYDSGGWFGDFVVPRTRQNGTEEREVGGGSGFIVGADGMIVTNRHVVSDTDARYSILLNDGTVYDVSVLARDPQLDIAILQIAEPPADPLPFLRFGASETIQLGQTVIAIGNALAEFRNSVSVGVVSGVSRSIVASDGFGRSELLDQVIQTDAAINPGNSGGPLLNLDGEVVGVNVATSRGADNIGFALPAEVVENVVSSVREYGEIVRPFLGVRYTMISESMATMNNLPVTYGALVTAGQNSAEPAVQPESPAALAGITEGTIILEIDGEVLRDRDLATALRSKTVGEDVTLLLLQEGEEKTVSVTLQKAVQ